MKLKLFSIFLLSQLLEFGVFWFVSELISNYWEINQFKAFLTLVGIDTILTGIFCSTNVKEFFNFLLEKNEQN